MSVATNNYSPGNSGTQTLKSATPSGAVNSDQVQAWEKRTFRLVGDPRLPSFTGSLETAIETATNLNPRINPNLYIDEIVAALQEAKQVIEHLMVGTSNV
jgi:hypothetical protein